MQFWQVHTSLNCFLYHDTECFHHLWKFPWVPFQLISTSGGNHCFDVFLRIGFDCFQFSSVQSLSRVQLFATPWIAARQASLSITNSWSSLKLMPIESGTPSNHLILCHPFSSCLQSFPTSASFQMSQLFTSGGQNIGVSASTSVLPMNTQD